MGMDNQIGKLHLPQGKDCCGCGTCSAACPVSAIRMVRDKYGFEYSVVDKETCIHCGKCIKACPAINLRKKSVEEICFAAAARNEDIVLNSSSGGIFSVLAEEILNRNGVVYGCCMTGADSISHVRLEMISDLPKIRGSKYVSGRASDCFHQVLQDLNNGRQVLFSGVPCQLAGLQQYLGKEYDNLHLVGVICHGMPSRSVWNKYISEIRETYGLKDIEMVSFRDKRTDNCGWQHYHFTVSGITNQGEKKTFSEIFTGNVYMKAFLSDLCLRPSCHCCKYRAGKSGADIILGDFWEIKNIPEGMDRHRGISAVIVHTQNGKKLWEDVQSSVIASPVLLSDITAGNPVYWKSCEIPLGRKYFMTHYQTTKLSCAWEKAMHRPVYVRAIRKGLRILHLNRLISCFFE